MRIRAFVAVIALALSVSAAAHDFWLQPRIFVMPAPAEVPFTILVGHGQYRQRWAAPASRVVSLRSIGPDGIVEHRGDVSPGEGPADGTIALRQPGTYILALETNAAKSELPALRFNTYLKDEGIASILAYRAKAGKTAEAGREIYSRRAKALVQAGPLDAASSALVTRPIGFTLEIVPEANPYALKPKAPLPLRVLYFGKPLPGAFVKLTNLDFDAIPSETHVTDPAGRAVFAAPPRGAWQFNVIWSRPIGGNADGDYETVFSSLTFGVPPKPLVQ